MIRYYLLFTLSWLTLGAVAQEPTKNLDFFLNKAKISSPVLKDLENQRKTTGIDSMIVRASAKPQVTGTSNGLYAPTYMVMVMMK